MNSQNQELTFAPAKCIKCSRKVPWVCCFSNFTLAVFKFIVGIIAGSQGLIAEGIHSLCDVVANIGVLISLRFAKKPEDEEYPYGMGKAEFLSCIFVYSILFIASLFIIYEALISIITKRQSAPDLVSLFAAVVSVIANYALFRITICAGTKVNSPAIVADAYENKADMLSSMAVILGILGSNLGYYYADPMAALIVGGIVFMTASKNGWKALVKLIDTSVPPEKLEALSKVIRKIEKIERVNYIKARAVGRQYWLDVNVQVAPELTVREGDEISKNVRTELIVISKHIKDIVVTLSCVKQESKKSLLKSLLSRA